MLKEWKNAAVHVCKRDGAFLLALGVLDACVVGFAITFPGLITAYAVVFSTVFYLWIFSYMTATQVSFHRKWGEYY